MSEKQSNDSRRKLLKSIAVGGSAVVAGKSLPENWAKPVVDSVILPAHAATSAPTTTPVPCTEPELLRIEFQDGYNESGTNPVITTIDLPVGLVDKTDGFYLTAWGYYADAPTTPVYINTKVLWNSSDPTVAHTGSGQGIVAQQSSSFISTPSVGTAIITAGLPDLCRKTTVTAEFTVNVNAVE